MFDAVPAQKAERFRGARLFGYNKKTHALHFALYVPVSAAMAGICLLF